MTFDTDFLIPTGHGAQIFTGYLIPTGHGAQYRAIEREVLAKIMRKLNCKLANIINKDKFTSIL